MQRAKAGFAIIFLIVGAIIFSAFMEGIVSGKFFEESESEAELSTESE